jgi:cell division protein FtsB
MNEREELIREEKSFIFSSFYKILLAVIVIMAAIFLGKILFGTRSLEVYFDLEEKEKILQKKIKKQKEENAKLQKKLFEYQLIVPDSE